MTDPPGPGMSTEMASSIWRLTSAEIAATVLLAGNLVDLLATRTNVLLPPKVGDGRDAMLLAQGLAQLNTAKRKFHRAMELTGCPLHHYFDWPHAPWWFYGPDVSFGRDRCRHAFDASNTAKL